jgi:hypothetical protein
MIEIGSMTSRRALLGALTVVPIAALPDRAAASPWGAAIGVLPYASPDQPVVLQRSRKGRNDSRFRYYNAESFFLGIEKGIARHLDDRLYQTGIVLQLGLSSHLLDVGFTDRWCASHVGLNIARSLACANATGFGFHLPEFDQLTAILSPYSKWRSPQPHECAQDFPFAAAEIRALTRTLLDHVHQVTGHPRPRGWKARHG